MNHEEVLTNVKVNIKISTNKTLQIAQAFHQLEKSDLISLNGSEFLLQKYKGVPEGFSRRKYIVDMFRDWGYTVELHLGYFKVRSFDRMNIEDYDEILWKKMAPLIENGTNITFEWERHSVKWKFKNGTIHIDSKLIKDR